MFCEILNKCDFFKIELMLCRCERPEIVGGGFATIQEPEEGHNADQTFQGTFIESFHISQQLNNS